MSGLLNSVGEKSISYTAGATETLKLDYLPLTRDALPNHVRAVTLELAAALTPDASTGDNGEDIMGGIIEELRVKDRAGNLVVRLKGFELRDFMRFVAGRDPYVDPSDVTAGGAAATYRAYARIPIGDATSLPFLKGDDDALQPVARFNLGQATIEVSWKGTPSINATVGSSTVLKVSWELEALSDLISGADVRFLHHETTDRSKVFLDAADRLAMAAFVDPSRSFSSISQIIMSQAQISEPVTVAALVKTYQNHVRNYAALQDPQAPDYVPLLAPTPGAYLTKGTIHPEGGRFPIDVTASGTGTIYVGMVHVRTQRELIAKVGAEYATVYGWTGRSKMLLAGHRPRGARAGILEAYGPHKLELR